MYQAVRKSHLTSTKMAWEAPRSVFAKHHKQALHALSDPQLQCNYMEEASKANNDMQLLTLP